MVNKSTIRSVKEQILKTGVTESEFDKVFQVYLKKFGNLVTEETLITMVAKEFNFKPLVQGGISYNLDIIDDDDRSFENTAYIECYFLSSSKGYTKMNPRECRHVFVIDSRKIVHVQVSATHLLEVVDKLKYGDQIRLSGFSKFGRNLGLAFDTSNLTKEEVIDESPLDVLVEEYSSNIDGVNSYQTQQGKACSFLGIVASSFVSNSYLGCMVCMRKIVQNRDQSRIGTSMVCPKCHNQTTVKEFSFTKLIIGDSSNQIQATLDSGVSNIDSLIQKWVVAIGFWNVSKYGPEFKVVYVSEKQKKVNEMLSPQVKVVEDEDESLDSIVETDIIAYVKNIGSMDMVTLSKKLKAFNCKQSTEDVIDHLVHKDLVVLEDDLLVIKNA